MWISVVINLGGLVNFTGFFIISPIFTACSNSSDKYRLAHRIVLDDIFFPL